MNKLVLIPWHAFDKTGLSTKLRNLSPETYQNSLDVCTSCATDQLARSFIHNLPSTQVMHYVCLLWSSLHDHRVVYLSVTSIGRQCANSQATLLRSMTDVSLLTRRYVIGGLTMASTSSEASQWVVYRYWPSSAAANFCRVKSRTSKRRSVQPPPTNATIANTEPS